MSARRDLLGIWIMVSAIILSVPLWAIAKALPLLSETVLALVQILLIILESSQQAQTGAFL